jgi:putative tricarboxylic transport membrane protein
MKSNTGLSFRVLIGFLVFPIIFFYSANTVRAEEFPSKPINLIITVSPGSSSDIFARMLAKATEDATGQEFVPKNKPGGGHAIGISYVMSQPADGYTIFSQTDTLAYSLATGKLPFGVDDLQPIVMATTDPNLLVVNSASTIKNIDDFIKVAKEKPGNIKVAVVGSHSSFAYLADQMNSEMDIQLTRVPYAGGSKVRMAILGENVGAAIISSGNVREHLKSGKLRALAIFTAERDEYSLKDVPTFKELGYNIEDVHWRGILTRKDVPKERIEKLVSMFKKGMQTERWKEYLAKHEQTGAFRDTEEFTKIFVKGAESAKAWMDSQ